MLAVGASAKKSTNAHALAAEQAAACLTHNWVTHPTQNAGQQDIHQPHLSLRWRTGTSSAAAATTQQQAAGGGSRNVDRPPATGDMLMLQLSSRDLISAQLQRSVAVHIHDAMRMFAADMLDQAQTALELPIEVLPNRYPPNTRCAAGLAAIQGSMRPTYCTATWHALTKGPQAAVIPAQPRPHQVPEGDDDAPGGVEGPQLVAQQDGHHGRARHKRPSLEAQQAAPVAERALGSHRQHGHGVVGGPAGSAAAMRQVDQLA